MKRRRATFISERLQSLAVDMNRLLETTVSEDDWRRFNRGEKGIFVRKMLGFREKAKLDAIKQKYQDDDEFRRYVTRYLSQFESLLKEATKRDHDGILNATFMSSDMGKVAFRTTTSSGGTSPATCPSSKPCSRKPRNATTTGY